MKKVLITLKKDDAPNITQLLGGAYSYREEIDDRVRFTLVVPDTKLDDLVSRIRTVLDFVDKETLVEVYSPDFTIFPAFDEKKKQEEGSREKKKEKSPIEKLLASVESYEKLDTKILTLAGVASIVGLIGLFLNNVGIIIGAMLIAPMIGPIYSFASILRPGTVSVLPGISSTSSPFSSHSSCSPSQSRGSSVFSSPWK
ncbi:MAG TPA: hypothetical protein PK679_03425 [Methanolinea sp.]|nr:hypothetical protein [Methanolinea sp.]